VGAVRESLRPDWLWLLFVAVASRYPTPDEVAEGIRTFELSGPLAATLWLLDNGLAGASGGSAPGRELRLVCHAVLVEVDHSARRNLHTGIQQVVRQLLPRWVSEHDVIPVVWTERWGAHRALSSRELGRVLSWGTDHCISPAVDDEDEVEQTPLVVPWQSVVVMAEVPFGGAPRRLSALAQVSGNHLVAIGYDCIPVVSADLVPTADANRFVNYLSAIKHAERVAGISASATLEFQGFTDTLPTQGLRGPVVLGCMLPSPPHTGGERNPPTARDRPLVLMVGSFEPRKNHLGVLHAAERLWRSGLDFALQFIGGSGWGYEVPDRIAELKQAGRPITVLHSADPSALELAYRSARFSVFPSKDEGFGLPVAESLAAGTPVITSNFGSMRELASTGGSLMIDPDDDHSLENAMRILLTDDVELDRLRAQLASRPARDWDDYARELWAILVNPLVTAEVGSEPSP
jgi:glycosyltransferase involved in cell wall biosynthesis